MGNINYQLNYEHVTAIQINKHALTRTHSDPKVKESVVGDAI